MSATKVINPAILLVEIRYLSNKPTNKQHATRHKQITFPVGRKRLTISCDLLATGVILRRCRVILRIILQY